MCFWMNKEWNFIDKDCYLVAGLLCNLEDLENLEKSGNLYLTGKIREFQHFIQNSGKVREFEKNFRLEAIFMPSLKPNLSILLHIISTLNSLFSLFFFTKGQILVNVICNGIILVFSSNAIFIVPCESLIHHIFNSRVNPQIM